MPRIFFHQWLMKDIEIFACLIQDLWGAPTKEDKKKTYGLRFFFFLFFSFFFLFFLNVYKHGLKFLKYVISNHMFLKPTGGYISEQCYILSFYPSKFNVTFKIQFDQNSIVVHHKFNCDFKSHIRFERLK
jgi:hypothetical protein